MKKFRFILVLAMAVVISGKIQIYFSTSNGCSN